MAITIDDIYDKEFALKGDGYDRDDVDQFLDEICDEMTNMQERMAALESDLSKAQAELKVAKEAARPAAQPAAQPAAVAQPSQPDPNVGDFMQEILLKAKRLADEEVEDAKGKAEEIIKAAEEKAGQIVDDAQEEKQTIEKSLSTMKNAAQEYRQSFLDLLKKHQNLLDEDTKLFDDKK